MTSCVQSRSDSGQVTVTLCPHSVDTRDFPKTNRQFGFVDNGGTDLTLYYLFSAKWNVTNRKLERLGLLAERRNSSL